MAVARPLAQGNGLHPSRRTRLARIAASPGRSETSGEWTALEFTILDVRLRGIDGIVLHFDDLPDPAVPDNRADDRLAAHTTAALARFHISTIAAPTRGTSRFPRGRKSSPRP